MILRLLFLLLLCCFASFSCARSSDSNVAFPHTVRTESPSNPLTHSKFLVPRVHHFTGCTTKERNYIQRLLHRDIRHVLQAGMTAASSPSDQYNRQKFVEYFGSFTDDFADEVRNRIMAAEMERARTPFGRWGFSCRVEQSACRPLFFEYLVQRRMQIVMVSSQIL